MPDPHVTTRFAPDGGLALANFVRSFELNSNITPRRRLEVCSGDPASPFDGKHRNLTTGTFNQVVKDRIAFPPERRVFSPVQSCYESNSVCPRNLIKISFCPRPSQSRRMHRISTIQLSAISFQLSAISQNRPAHQHLE